MPETGQSEWTAQALVAVGAVLLLLTALWLGVYAPGQKKLSDDFETTFEYGGELKVLDIPQFQRVGVIISAIVIIYIVIYHSAYFRKNDEQ